MESNAEKRLADLGISIDEVDFGREDEPDIIGCAVAWPVGDGHRVSLVVRPGIEPWQRSMFAEWATSRLGRLAEHGTEPDGWQLRSDGGWQLWSRLHQLPSFE